MRCSQHGADIAKATEEAPCFEHPLPPVERFGGGPCLVKYSMNWCRLQKGRRTFWGHDRRVPWPIARVPWLSAAPPCAEGARTCPHLGFAHTWHPESGGTSLKTAPVTSRSLILSSAGVTAYLSEENGGFVLTDMWLAGKGNLWLGGVASALASRQRRNRFAE